MDGKPIGMQHDSLAAYSLSGYPLTVEGLWSNAYGLYLAAGGGALVLRNAAALHSLAWEWSWLW